MQFTFHTTGKIYVLHKLSNKEVQAGEHSIVWNGMDQNGNRLASGTYLYRISVGGDAVNGRMTLMK